MRSGSRSTEANLMSNMAMQNICITLTGFEKEIADELTDLVQKMNGVISKDYSVECTHVVARTTLTPKCRAAYKNDIAVMTEDWIRAVWKESQDHLVDATNSKFIEYTCPIFHNVHICVSQLTPSMKAIIQSTITTNGGTYSKDFKLCVTDILVTPYATGEKYKFAKKWNVACVTPEWIDKCRQEGHVVPFDKFLPPRSPKEYLCSTQIDPQTTGIFPDLNNMTACSAVTDLQDNSRMDLDTINVNLTNWTDTSCVSSAVSSNQEGQDVLMDEMLTILRRAPEGFLDSCTIYLCEHSSNDGTIVEIRKILNSSGATRLDRITEKVSHVLVISDKISEQEIQAIKAIDHEPDIVTLEWLVESARLGSQVNEERYAFEMPTVSKKNVVKDKVNPLQQSNFKTITPTTGFNLSGAVKAKELPTKNSSDLESDLEQATSILLKTPVGCLSTDSKAEESPHFNRLTKIVSEQIREAFAVSCDEPSPGTSETLNKSTPMREVRNRFINELEIKAKRYKQSRIQETPSAKAESMYVGAGQDASPLDRRQVSDQVLLLEGMPAATPRRSTRSTGNESEIQTPPQTPGRQTRSKGNGSFHEISPQVKGKQIQQAMKSPKSSTNSPRASMNKKRNPKEVSE